MILSEASRAGSCQSWTGCTWKQTSRRPPVRSHLNRAIELLSDRTSPDYRNAIKQSISAIEALCRIVAGDEKGTCTLLNRIDGIHAAFKQAQSKMYGFASDAEGIRHADAKFFLVQAGSFVN